MTDIDAGSAGSEPVSAPVVETPVTESTPEQMDQAVDADLQKIWDRANPPRENGKFVSRNPEGAEQQPETNSEGQSPTEENAEQPDQAAIGAPQSWPAEMKAKWATVPPEVREIITKRETEAATRISQLGQDAAAFKPLKAILDRNQDVFARKNMAPAQGVERLLAAQEYLDRDPENAIKWLAQHANIDLAKLAGVSTTTGEQPPANDQVAALSAQVATLTRQLHETSNRVSYRERQETESRETDLISRIDKFSSDKPDWAVLETDIVANIQAIQASSPGLAPEHILEQAYERAVWANPQTRTQRLAADEAAKAEKAEKERRDQVAKARKGSSVNVRGDHVSGAAPTSMDDELGQIAAKHYGKR